MDEEIIKNLDLLINLEELQSEEIWDNPALESSKKKSENTDTKENLCIVVI